MKNLLFVVVLLFQLLTRTQSILISQWNACAPDCTNFRISYGMSLLQCMRECHVIESCKSISYHRKQQQCRLDLRDLESMAGIETCLVNVLVNKQEFSWVSTVDMFCFFLGMVYYAVFKQFSHLSRRFPSWLSIIGAQDCGVFITTDLKVLE